MRLHTPEAPPELPVVTTFHLPNLNLGASSRTSLYHIHHPTNAMSTIARRAGTKALRAPTRTPTRQHQRRWASDQEKPAAEAGEQKDVLRKAAQRDPELYTLFAIMTGAFVRPQPNQLFRHPAAQRRAPVRGIHCTNSLLGISRMAFLP